MRVEDTADRVLSLIRQARTAANAEASQGLSSRDLSMVITKLDEAELWRLRAKFNIGGTTP